MITVCCPISWPSHRHWIVTSLLGRLGLPVAIVPCEREHWSISINSQPGAIILPDLFLGSLTSQDATKGLSPLDPSPWCQFSAGEFKERLPILFGSARDAWSSPITPGAELKLDVDIFGTAFWLMSRVEEFGPVERDSHDRYSAFKSLAWRNHFLMLPVVDEYMRLIAALIGGVWPGLKLPKPRSFNQFLSHDVDDPFVYRFMPLGKAARLIAANAIKGGRPIIGLRWGAGLAMSLAGIKIDDPCDTFDWLMDVSEQAGVSSTFFFIASDRSNNLDANYDITDSAMVDLMRRVAMRGHEIGLHPGYATFRDPTLLGEQANRLREGMCKANVTQPEIGSRMHYLRWDGAITPVALSEAGIFYDSTLGFADHPGFRCGTCHPFPYFNPLTGTETKLYIRPLIAMECTVLAKRYMNLGATPAAFEVFSQLKERCRRVGGEFSLLWHNSFLFSPAEKELYRAIVMT